MYQLKRSRDEGTADEHSLKPQSVKIPTMK